MNENSIQELIDSFIAYRKLIAPIEESLAAVGKTYGEIRDDLAALNKNLSDNAPEKLEKVHAALSAQAKNGQELSRRIDEFSKSGESYARAVAEFTSLIAKLSDKMSALEDTEKRAREQIERIDALLEEKRASYNLKDLQKSLDRYNSGIEKISDFINKDIAEVMRNNADKIEGIRKENEDLKAVVLKQSGDIATLMTMLGETTALLKNAVEGSSVNEQYLFDAFDKWAASRKVKIKKQ